MDATNPAAGSRFTGEDMEARSRFIGFPREAILVAAALLLVLAAMAGGYVLRLTTAPAGGSVTVVSSGAGTSSPAQSIAPCVWTAVGKGC
jgi:hypothetical protein